MMNQPTVYVGAQRMQSRDSFVYALKADTGSLVWRYALHDTSSSFPVASTTGVYFSAGNGSVYALQANDGAVLWRTPGRGEMPISLVATQDVVYLVEPERGLSALQASDGSPLWHQPSSYAGLRDPLMHNGILYLNAHDSLHARRARDGSLLWRFHARRRGILSLAALNGMLFVCGGRNTTVEVYALRTGDGSRVWRWRTSLQEGGVTTPDVTHEGVYVGIGASDGLYALHVSKGSILWHALGDMGVTTAAVGARRL